MGERCPILNFFGFLSKRWMILVLKSLNDGKETFSDIKKGLNGISSRILSERLTELQDGGYVERIIIQEKPVKIRYKVTKKGESLGKCINDLNSWVIENENN